MGLRWHALGSVARPFVAPGWTVTPRLSLNAAAYSLDEPLGGRRERSRTIPTFSVDSAWQLEREANWFGRDVAADAGAAADVREHAVPHAGRAAGVRRGAQGLQLRVDLYAENAFSGVDRVADAHQITAGVTTRLLDPASGAEALRLGVVQRYLFRDQKITSDCTPSADPLIAPEGTPLTQRFSDVLLLGSTTSTGAGRWTAPSSTAPT